MSEPIHHVDLTNRPMNNPSSLPASLTETQAEVVVAGHICLDVIPTLADRAILFAPGQTIEAGRAVFATGGAVANTGMALHKLGIATRLMGKVGSDLYGQAILQIVETHGHGLADSMIVVPDEASSYSIILSTPNADRMLIHAPGCNATFGADDVDYNALETVRLFHFGYPPLMERMYADNGVEMATLFQRVKAKGITTSLDLSMPDPQSAAGRADWHTILSATLPYVDICLPSAEETLLMLRRPIFDQLAASGVNARPLHLITPAMVAELGQTLLAMGAKIVGLKLGERGLYLCTANETALLQMGRGQVTDATAWSERELWSPCFATSVAGTTGSGDATIAGFLAALLRGMTPEETLVMACAVGACSVEAVDALNGIRSWQETTERVATWSRLPLALEHAIPGWRWHEQYQVWVGANDRLSKENSMLTREQWMNAQERARKFLAQANIVITDDEKKNIEVADFGLNTLETIGLELVVYVNTERVCAKELVLFPRQTCPEHRHPPIGNEQGKEETFRCRWGTVYLYVEGEATAHPGAQVPAGKEHTFTVWHEIVLQPGQQYTIPPNTLHWFQAGDVGAVVSEFSTRSRDEFDIFTDQEIKRATMIV